MTTRPGSILLTMILPLGLGLAACGDDGAGGGSGSVEARMAAAYCDVVRDCAVADTGENVILMLARQVSTAECRTFVRRSFLARSQYDAKIAAGTYTVDEAKLSQCLSGLKASCGLNPPGICEEAISGTVALGAACESSEECAGDAWCDGFGCNAKCVARVAIGEPCESPSQCSSLARSATCNYETNTCAAIVSESGAAAGAQCGEVETGTDVKDVRCAAGLACVWESEADHRVCRAPIAAGGACNDDDAPCALGTICLPDGEDSGKCGSINVANAVGATCDEGEDPTTSIYCNPVLFLGCVAGKCAAAGDGTVGATCFAVADVGGECLPENMCDRATNKCVAKKADGAPCESGTECVSGQCSFTGDTGTCATDQCL